MAWAVQGNPEANQLDRICLIQNASLEKGELSNNIEAPNSNVRKRHTVRSSTRNKCIPVKLSNGDFLCETRLMKPHS